eukprot:1846748-Rhodomonas_salina.1
MAAGLIHVPPPPRAARSPPLPPRAVPRPQTRYNWSKKSKGKRPQARYSYCYACNGQWGSGRERRSCRYCYCYAGNGWRFASNGQCLEGNRRCFDIRSGERY